MEDDRSLVTGILKGEPRAFQMLIKQNERLVAHMIGRLVKDRNELEELCQDVFLQVYKKIGEFNFKSKLSTWIATIAYRMAVNNLKKKKMQFLDLGDDDGFRERFIEASDPGRLVEEKDQERFVLQLVDRLPPHYKSVLMLYHVEGLSYTEIAEITEMPEGTVKSYIFRARNLLKESIMKYIGKEELS